MIKEGQMVQGAGRQALSTVPALLIMSVLKFILPIFTILSFFNCSNIIFNDENFLKIERLKLVRQSNSPESQRMLRELSRKLRRLRLKSVKECGMSLEEAWNAYECGNREILFTCIRKGKFDPNGFVGGERSLLIKAILSGDSELFQEILEIPEIDVNFIGNSGLLPIELCFNNRVMFDSLLLRSDINLLARDAFCFNPIKQALNEGRLDLVEKMLKRVEVKN